MGKINGTLLSLDKNLMDQVTTTNLLVRSRKKGHVGGILTVYIRESMESDKLENFRGINSPIELLQVEISGTKSYVKMWCTITPSSKP